MVDIGIGIGQYWYWSILPLVGIGIGPYRYWSVLALVDIGIAIAIALGISITPRKHYLEKLLIFHKV